MVFLLHPLDKLNSLFFRLFFWLLWVFIAACRLFLVVASRGYSPGVVRKLLTAVASHVAGTGSRAHRLQQLQLLGS